MTALLRKRPSRIPTPKRIHVTLPGVLREAIETRAREFFYPLFSPFALELICFDLRMRRDHDVTRPFSRDEPNVQDAIDRQIIGSYRPNAPRNFEMINKILRGEPWLTEPIDDTRGDFAAYREKVVIPGKLRRIVRTRWKELGYESFSCYLTGLIRYDLMLSGPHTYFNGHDTHPDLLAALDEETVRTFHARKRQKLLLDYLIERAAGRVLTPEETQAEMQRLAKLLRENALRSRRGQRASTTKD